MQDYLVWRAAEKCGCTLPTLIFGIVKVDGVYIPCRIAKNFAGHGVCVLSFKDCARTADEVKSNR